MIHTIEKLSARQAAAAGGIGSGISIATVISLDPLALTPWLRVATLAVGLFTPRLACDRGDEARAAAPGYALAPSVSGQFQHTFCTLILKGEKNGKSRLAH